MPHVRVTDGHVERNARLLLSPKLRTPRPWIATVPKTKKSKHQSRVPTSRMQHKPRVPCNFREQHGYIAMNNRGHPTAYNIQLPRTQKSTNGKRFGVPRHGTTTTNTWPHHTLSNASQRENGQRFTLPGDPYLSRNATSSGDTALPTLREVSCA